MTTLPDAAAPAGRRTRRLLAVLAVVAVLVLGFLVGRRLLLPYLYHGTVLQTDGDAPPMQGLVYADDGTAVDLAAYRGRTVVVFFGYTNCPDVCPTTLATTAAALRDLGERAGDVQVLMVTVDPARDAPAQLAAYVSSFHPSFRGVTGSVDDLARVATTYGVFFAPGEDPAIGGMDHTATLTGIGPDGRLRISWPSTVRATDLAADLEHLDG